MRVTAYSAGTDLLSLQLKAAKKEGRLSEALLDRRAKLKRSVDYKVSLNLSHSRSTPVTVSVDLSYGPRLDLVCVYSTRVWLQHSISKSINVSTSISEVRPWHPAVNDAAIWITTHSGHVMSMNTTGDIVSNERSTISNGLSCIRDNNRLVHLPFNSQNQSTAYILGCTVSAPHTRR